MWGIDGRLAWIGLELSHQLLRAYKPFAEDKGGVHKVYWLRRGDIAVFKGNTQLGSGGREGAGRTDIRFRWSKIN